MPNELALPALYNIKDGDVRACFQSLIAFFAANKFVTTADLSQTTRDGTVGGLIPAGFPGGGPLWNQPPGPGEVSEIIGFLENQIRESALFRRLGERIDLIDKPVTGIVFRLGEAEGSITGLEGSLQGVEVAIASERDARISQDNAILVTTSTQWAQTNAVVSLQQNQITTISNNFAALSAEVTTLQATIGSGGGVLSAALAEEAEVRADADGHLYGRWDVRIDLNGRVAGFGIDATGTRTSMSSMALFRVDTFAIAGTTAADSASTRPVRAPGESEASYQARLNAWGDAITAAARSDVSAALARSEDTPGVVAVPFIVKTGYWTDQGGITQPPGVYMRRAMIQKLVVDTAYIRDLAVTTLKIENESVMVPRYRAFGGTPTIDGGVGTVVSLGAMVIDFGAASPSAIAVEYGCTINQVTGSGATMGLTCDMDGSQLGSSYSIGIGNNIDSNSQVALFAGGGDRSLHFWYGIHTFSIAARLTFGSGIYAFKDGFLRVTGIKK